jgi:hypothetical protein
VAWSRARITGQVALRCNSGMVALARGRAQFAPGIRPLGRSASGFNSRSTACGKPPVAERVRAGHDEKDGHYCDGVDDHGDAEQRGQPWRPPDPPVPVRNTDQLGGGNAAEDVALDGEEAQYPEHSVTSPVLALTFRRQKVESPLSTENARKYRAVRRPYSLTEDRRATGPAVLRAGRRFVRRRRCPRRLPRAAR